MRYKELRVGRDHLESAIAYFMANCGADTQAYEEGLMLLRVAIKSIRTEIKRPELFNLDGTVRLQKISYA